MWRQVPQHVDVFLVNAEIYARGTEKVDVAQNAVANVFLYLPHGGTVYERLTHHQSQILVASQFRQFSRLQRRYRQRLLDQDGLTALQNSLGNIVVGADRCGDHERVTAMNDVVQVFYRINTRKSSQHSCQRTQRRSQTEDLSRTVRFHSPAPEVRTPVAEATRSDLQ